jgi:hypothetical protein
MMAIVPLAHAGNSENVDFTVAIMLFFQIYK